MNIFYKKTNKRQLGFTLVETMIAIFILTLAMTSLLGLTSQGLFAARYSRNDITANYLLQEVADFVRNERDTIAFEQSGQGGGWANFLETFGSSIANSKCFSSKGCYFDLNNYANNTNLKVKTCDAKISFGKSKCPLFYYDSNATDGSFYNYDKNVGTPSNFKRKINFKINPNNPDEVYVTITVEWLNGSLAQSRSLYLSLLNWAGS